MLPGEAAEVALAEILAVVAEGREEVQMETSGFRAEGVVGMKVGMVDVKGMVPVPGQPRPVVNLLLRLLLLSDAPEKLSGAH